MNMYYNPELSEKQTNFQADINAKSANYQGAVNRLGNIYNFEGSRAITGDQTLASYYSKYNL